MIIETALTILGIAEKATKIFDWFTGLSTGKKMEQHLSKIGSGAVRLSENILFAPNFQQAINKDAAVSLNNPRNVFELINPVAEALHTDFLVSAVNATPERLKQAFRKDPWEVLIDIRPANKTKQPTNPDLVAVTFIDENIPYIGWQTRGALPILLNCDFESDGNIINPFKQTMDTRITESTYSGAFTIRSIKPELLQLLKSKYSNDRLYFEPIPANIVPSNSNDFFAVLDCSLSNSARGFLAFGSTGIHYQNLVPDNQKGLSYVTYLELTRLEIQRGFQEVVIIGNRHFIDISGAPFPKGVMERLLLDVRRIASSFCN